MNPILNAQTIIAIQVNGNVHPELAVSLHRPFSNGVGIPVLEPQINQVLREQLRAIRNVHADRTDLIKICEMRVVDQVVVIRGGILLVNEIGKTPPGFAYADLFSEQSLPEIDFIVCLEQDNLSAAGMK